MHEIEITPELEAYAQQALASGQYNSLDELVAEALSWHRAQFQSKNRLRADLQIGIDQLDQGFARDVVTPEEHSQFKNDILQRIQRGGHQTSRQE